MSTRPDTTVRTWLSAGFAAILTATTWLVAQAPDQPQSFTTLQNGFTQQLIGTTPSLYDPQFGILGGVAFAPNGDVWSSECLFANTRMHRFDMQQTTTVNGTAVHPESIVEPPESGTGGCGLVNHPDGFLYSNSMFGIWRLNATTGLPAGGVIGGANAVAGNGLGLAVDPQQTSNNHVVYVGADCHPSLSPDSTTCTLYDLDPTTGETLVFARLHRAEGMFLDGIYFDPSGNYVFAAHREIDFNTFETHHSLAVIRRPAALGPLNALVDDSQLAQLVPMTEEPDGVAFHAQQGFVVTLNESDGGTGVGGTISRFDFPGGYEAPPQQSLFAAGGFRGDLLQVGGDGCIYATQGKLYQTGGLYATRYDNGQTSSDDSIVQICGGFAPPPGVQSKGSVAGVAYHDLNHNGVRDSGEPGLANVEVTLSGAASATTATDAAGAYSFTQLVAGSYMVSAPISANDLDRGTASPLDATITPGQNRTGLDFGYVNGGLSGVVYADLNKNGVRDTGEPGLVGVTVTLGGGSTATTTSGAGGAYTFIGLLAGSYSLASPATAQGLALGTTSPLTPTLVTGGDQTGYDFGYVSGTISGFAYVDANRNSVKDGNEAGIGGVVISGPNGATTSTAADGSYSFTNIEAGTHSVSAPATAAGKALFTTSPLSVEVAAGGTAADNNFGYVTGDLSGFAYVDANRNSTKDAGEAGLGGVTITGPGGATTTTAADGSYSFSNLDAGTYSVNAPSTASGKGLFTPSPLSVTIAAGGTSANNNFGYVTGGLSGFAYVDANRNGAKDSGEAVLGGVVISGPGGTTTTAADGSYSFTNLDAGTYPVSAPATASGKALFTPSPLSVVVAAGATSTDHNFGYVTGSLSGFAYVDANRNGVKDASEAGLGGVVISGPGGTTTTAADGSYSFSNLDAGTYPVGAPATASGKALFTATPLSVVVAAGATSANNNFGYVTGGLSGFAYVDANRNGVKDSGEAGIGGVAISGPGGTTTTAADGSYSFNGLDAGTYPVGAPSTASGKALFTTTPLSVTIAAGATSPNNDFGYVTGGLSGFAYVDANRNSVKDSGEAGLGGVVITGPAGGTTTTAADGSYSFSNLDAGTYSLSAPSTASGKALFTTSPLSVDLAAGATSANNNFGYVTGGLSGFAYVDANRNGVKDAGEAGIGNVTITGPGGTTTTAADGSYSFSSLDAGTYSVSAPSSVTGKALFTASPLSVTIAAGATSANNNFGYVTGSLSGFAYVDANRNGIKDAGEAGIGGVLITGPGGTATTAADGSYSFSGLDAGTYPVSAPSTASGKALFTASPLSVVVAAGGTSANNNFGYVMGGLSGFAYVDANRNGVKDAGEAGIGNVTISGPGGTTTTAADGSYAFSNLDAGSYSVSAPSAASGKALFTASPLSVTIAAGATSANNNFGYVTGGISGFAYVDANRNGAKDAGEAGIGNVTISGPGGTTTTAADGSYSFSNLNAGTYSVSAPSTASGKALFTASPLSVTIAAGATSANNNFGYVTGGLSGFAYVDANRNSIKDAGEAGIGGVIITGPGGTTTTAADGSYSFGNLDGGTYSVSAPSTASGKALFTASPLSVAIAAGATSANNNFGYVTGTISGFTYVDTNKNGVRDSGEAGIAGVSVTLSGAAGATTTTAADGSYSFSNLVAGNYSVSAPSTAGSLILGTQSPLVVTLAAGEQRPNVNFGYVSNSNQSQGCTGTIGDFVWVDINRNGLQDAGEPGLSTTVILKNSSGVQIGSMTSNSAGQYQFTGLCAGSYTVEAPPPPGYDQTGTAVGTNRAIDSNGSPASVTLATDSSSDQTIDFGYVNGFCEKQPVQTELNPAGSHFPNNKGPDVIVRVHKGQSVQAAIDQASDVNGDGYIIVAVVARDGGLLGGSTSQQVVISRTYAQPFAVIGCSVTLNDPTPGDANPTARVLGSASAPADGIGARIFVMDLHANGSAVAGWLVEGNNRYLRNVYARSNAVGVKFVGNANTMHNGTVENNTGAGLIMQGGNGLITDTDAFSNGGHGVQVIGNTNQILKVDSGDSGKGNGGDGIHVEGSGNLIQETAVFANTGDGIDVVASTGSPNILKKNVVGDRSGKGNGGNGISVAGPGNGTATPIEIEENTLKANGLTGILITGTGHQLKNNVSGGTGTGETNLGCEFSVAAGNFNATGNKANGTTVAGSNGSAFPTSCIGQ